MPGSFLDALAGLTLDAEEMHKAGAHTKGILAYLRERSGKLVALRDVHSMIQSFKREQRAGLTDAERALAILDEFCAESTGNVAEIMVDAESKVARVITFQSARMKRLFRAFPEVFRCISGVISVLFTKIICVYLEDVEVQGSLSVRPFNVGQRVPKITKILQLDKIQEAITAIKAKGNLNLLANWSDFGYATLDQLEAMARVLEARNRFRLVQFTLDWIDGVEWHIQDAVHPFTDVCDYTKQEYMKSVKGMCLGEVRLGPEWSLGCSLVDFRENLWLHTSSIISAMLALQHMYANVGFVNPSYHDFAGLSVKKKTAAGFGSMDSSNDRIIAVICLDHHWVAYLLDKLL
ncbi:hypothetical protein PF008_g7570 [Phytophthora fragariae]|uniref:ZSWIM1/3 RNaseH-like domain-containing protein n=1 Tax=Phytophthora fragariae TaxID=53985 RepID=A0A6G0S3Q3_9STRA|nr:hypothetical protein PF008_g7570 [Phytophthora fragariae]